jgi:hypothetical protein
MIQSEIAKWLDNAAKNAPVDFIRSCALQIQKTGYLTLGEFFEHVSDMELKSILFLIHEVGNNNDPVKARESQAGIHLLMLLLRIGAGIYTNDKSQLAQHILYFSHYVLHELSDRQFLCDRIMRSKRLRYSIEIKPEERK